MTPSHPSPPVPDDQSHTLGARLDEVENRLEAMDSNLRWARTLRNGLFGVAGLLAVAILVLDLPLAERAVTSVLIPVLVGAGVLFVGAGLLARRWGSELVELEERQARLVRELSAESTRDRREAPE